MEYLSQSKKCKKWIMVLSAYSFIYLTGLQSEIFGNLQRILLRYGFFQPELNQIHYAIPKNMDFQLLSLDNQPVNITDFKGKVIFLNFWATWNPPSIAEMPNIQSLFLKTNSDDIAYIMVAMDKDEDNVKKFLKRKGYTFPVYRLSNSVPGIFESAALPATFVICPQGKIVTRMEGLTQYDNEHFISFIKNLVNEPKKRVFSNLSQQNDILID
jgi:thiol-disulfide isomerase/thioredoxin